MHNATPEADHHPSPGSHCGWRRDGFPSDMMGEEVAPNRAGPAGTKGSDCKKSHVNLVRKSRPVLCILREWAGGEAMQEQALVGLVAFHDGPGTIERDGTVSWLLLDKLALVHQGGKIRGLGSPDSETPKH